MGQYARVKRRFWVDEQVQSLSPEARYLMLYLLTSPHGNGLGLYVLRPGYAAEDMGWDTKRFAQRLRELIEKGLVNYDETTNLLFIPRWLKHNPLENPNQVQAMLKVVEELPSSHLWSAAAQAVEQFCRPFAEPLAKRLRVGSANQYTVIRNRIDPVDSDLKDRDLKDSRSIEPANQRNDKAPGLFDEPIDKPFGNGSVGRKRRNKYEYSPEFEAAWAEYPRPQGKRAAYRAWQARLRDKLDDGRPITPDMLQQAVRHYAEACRRERRPERFIMRGSTFFGPDHPFADYLEPPAGKPARETAVDRLLREAMQRDRSGGPAGGQDAGGGVWEGGAGGSGEAVRPSAP